MVFVKVRETYDLNTVQNKLSLIAIHTPKADIIKNNYPGLLMQCKMYRPVSCDVKIACASMLPADPLQVSTASGDIAPEDLFNPILYKACTNMGMSQLEAYINYMANTFSPGTYDAQGKTAVVDIDPAIAGNAALTDHFNLYYGLLSDTHGWRHASPQSGLEMRNLKPLVYEALYTYGQNHSSGVISASTSVNNVANAPDIDTTGNPPLDIPLHSFRGNAKPMPFINCTDWVGSGSSGVGFNNVAAGNAETFVPAPQVVVGAIIVPPSRLHQLYYRMVVEWTLEFTSIRSINEITNMQGLVSLGNASHYQTYDYSTSKEAAGIEDSNLVNDTSLASASVEIKKVM